ncbi:hypothetical protein TRAPUB_9491 [Trametes pubescens]|uniref:CCHC-type domain-containing protein n=1 Tax=Trametes pubescens TaxID=154538 RepID=A0A1M2W2G9_TRAPU|nr:hypothetical protein TRAPUB_9491 [Trametes pubescens]
MVGSSPPTSNSALPVSAKARLGRGTGVSNAPTIAELMSNPPDKSATVHSVETALKHLKKVGWITSDVRGLSVEEACNTLLWANTMKPGAMQIDAVRSVVFLLYKTEQDRIAGEGTDSMVGKRLEALIDKLESAAEHAAEHLRRAPSTPPSSSPPSFEHDSTALSYAALASRNLPPQHSNVIEKSMARRRQVVLERVPLREHDAGPPLSEKELVVRASLAFDAMGEATADAPAGLAFRGARKLQGGKVAYDMESAQSADWLKQPDVMKSFLAHYDGGQSALKVTTYYVIAEFVPVSFGPGDPVALRKAEHNSGLSDFDILSGRWIKPENRRSSTQRVAHAILHMRSPESANHAIRSGLNIEGKTVSVRKLLQEPRRCLRCQKFDPAHLAADCTAKDEICGTCAGVHRTADCTVVEHMRRQCVNCGTTGHASWDRDCPVFADKFEKLSARQPGNWYRFFPTADPRTWEMLDSPGSAAPPPPTRAPSPPRSQPSPPSSQMRQPTNLGSIPLRLTHHQPMIDDPSDFPKTTFADSSRLRIWQQNVNRSLIAQLDLINNLHPSFFDIIALQEPYFDSLRNSRGSQRWIAVYPPDHQNPQHPTPRSFLLVNANISSNSWEPLAVPSPDITAIRMNTATYTVLIYNIYNAQDHDDTLHILSDDTRKRLATCPNRRQTFVVWLGDFNRHSPVWDAARNNHLFTTQNLAASDRLL